MESSGHLKTLEDIIETRFRDDLLEFQRKGLGTETPELTLHEKVLIYAYTKYLWEGLNEALRAGKGHLLEAFLNEVLSKLPDYDDLVFRGTMLSEAQKERFRQAAASMETFTDPTFVSTSKSIAIAEEFSRANTVFHIFGKTGKSVEHLSFFGATSPSNEKEVVFRSNTMFRVLHCTEADSKTIIILEETLSR